jgi:hypothetical protein
MKTSNTCWLYIIPALAFTPVAWSDYKADIGYTDLQNLLGANTPTGAGVKVTQIEAGGTVYAPDVTDPQFNGKTISFPGTASVSPSGHATWVGSIFYGTNSMANGITDVTSYEANEWLSSITYAQASAPVNGSRIANDSWVGNGNDPTQTGLISRLVDRQTQLYELVQVVGMANSPSVNPLLSSAYNVIAVGRSGGNLDYGSEAIDSVYVAGRTRPDVVSPESTTSAATPEVAATAALLVETGHSGALTLSKGSSTITGVGTVYNAERAETIKAALMAGADRVTANTSSSDNITDYGSNDHLTTNGLDERFGAGQVNVLHSYQVIAAGEQNSLEDGGANAGAIGLNGFDYDNAFGGALSSNNTATYKFDATNDSKLSAALVWNIAVANDGTLSTALPNLDLELFDVTTQSISAFSSSTLDNTENLWVNLVTGHNYELKVKSGEATNFSWDYALAWHINTITINASPVPLPSAFYLFSSAIAGLALARRRKRII